MDTFNGYVQMVFYLDIFGPISGSIYILFLFT